MNKLIVTQIANATNLTATTAYSFTADFNKAETIQFVYTSTTASFSIAVEHSLDGINWIVEGSATTVTDASGTAYVHLKEKDALYWRVNATRTSGTLTTFKAYVAYTKR
jgi:hypothetical protein